MESADPIKDLISYIATSLVDNPDAVEVKAVPGDRSTLYELTVGPDDLGKVIGKDGRTARAIRTLIAAAANPAGNRAVLEILE